MEQGEYLFSGNAWFRERLDGDDRFFWRKARRMFLFDHDLSSALNVFKFDYKAIKTEFGSEGTITLRGSRNTYLDPNEEREHVPGQSWADDAQNSIRALLDRIVTLWVPKYIKSSKISINKLHHTLTPAPLRYVQKTYDDTNNDVENYDVKKALETYQACLAPLYYHELWSEIVSDYKNVDTKLEERETTINIGLFYEQVTFDEEQETALIFGTNRVTYADSYQPLSKKLGLFDLILIKIDNVDYFGMVVHVEQKNKVHVPPENENSNDNSTTHTNHKNLTFEIQTTIGIYVSRTCSDLIKQRRKENNGMELTVAKLSNITSSRRMISAIHNLHEWSQHRSLLKPMIDDKYFQLPEDYDPSNVSPTNGFNAVQSKAIAIAECMFDDLFDRMHIVHGPPGTGKSRTIAGIVVKLLSKLSKPGYKNKKILLCAPSNNACDELSRRILEEFGKQDEPPKHGTLVRIGCQPPDDYGLCDHFFDFMILQEMVDVLKRERRPDPNLAQSTERKIMRHAKIVVSTLNYCGSTRMHQLKSSTAFVIIDEASQSSEADSLLPLRFKCNKVMLVGDPLQLPPCVLSDAGREYQLAESLYKRLYYIFENQNGPITMLDTQYRMHPDICRFPSEYFYNGLLKTDPLVAIRMKQFSLKPLFLYNIRSSRHHSDGASSSYNEGEAGFVRDFCQKLITHLAQESIDTSSNGEENRSNGYNSTSSHNSPQNDNINNIDGQVKGPRQLPSLPLNDPRSIKVQQRIAVITPYRAQVRVLRSYLPSYIEIMTADGSQGKEKDIVILSCVRSGDGNIGFLKDMNRLNVMLTRSKNALYVFGNLTQLASQHDSWQAFVKHAEVHGIISDVDGTSPDLPYRS